MPLLDIALQEEAKGDAEGDGEKRFDGSGYDKDLVEALERDILQKNPNVHWYENHKHIQSSKLQLKLWAWYPWSCQELPGLLLITFTFTFTKSQLRVSHQMASEETI